MHPATQPFPIKTVGNLCYSSHESSSERDTGVKESHLLTWVDEREPGDQCNWSRPKEEDLECPLPLEPHVQELLRGEEILPVSTGVGNSLPQTSMPEPYPMEGLGVDKVAMKQLDMPAWWQEL